MPICPICKQEIDKLFSDSRIDLVWHNNKWMIDVIDHTVIVCPNCYEEMGINDLDKLKVPLKLR